MRKSRPHRSQRARHLRPLTRIPSLRCASLGIRPLPARGERICWIQACVISGFLFAHPSRIALDDGCAHASRVERTGRVGGEPRHNDSPRRMRKIKTKLRRPHCLRRGRAGNLSPLRGRVLAPPPRRGCTGCRGQTRAPRPCVRYGKKHTGGNLPQVRVTSRHPARGGYRLIRSGPRWTDLVIHR